MIKSLTISVIGLMLGVLCTYEAINVLAPEGYLLYLGMLAIGPLVSVISIARIFNTNVDIEGED
jgi:hypothetical protein